MSPLSSDLRILDREQVQRASMFRLRVHSVDHLHLAENAGGATTSNQSPPPFPQNPNPRIQVRRGVIHLYHPTRSPSASSSSSLCHPPLESLLPVSPSPISILFFIMLLFQFLILNLFSEPAEHAPLRPCRPYLRLH